MKVYPPTQTLEIFGKESHLQFISLWSWLSPCPQMFCLWICRTGAQEQSGYFRPVVSIHGWEGNLLGIGSAIRSRQIQFGSSPPHPQVGSCCLLIYLLKYFYPRPSPPNKKIQENQSRLVEIETVFTNQQNIFRIEASCNSFGRELHSFGATDEKVLSCMMCFVDLF